MSKLPQITLELRTPHRVPRTAFLSPVTFFYILAENIEMLESIRKHKIAGAFLFALLITVFTLYYPALVVDKIQPDSVKSEVTIQAALTCFNDSPSVQPSRLSGNLPFSKKLFPEKFIVKMPDLTDIVSYRYSCDSQYPPESVLPSVHILNCVLRI